MPSNAKRFCCCDVCVNDVLPPDELGCVLIKSPSCLWDAMIESSADSLLSPSIVDSAWWTTPMSQVTTHRYVVTNDQILNGEPIIDGTRTPVRAIVELWRQGLTPETIPTRLPHLSLAQVYDALSYYSDNQAEIHGYLERNRIPDDLIDPLVKAPRIASSSNSTSTKMWTCWWRICSVHADSLPHRAPVRPDVIDSIRIADVLGFRYWSPLYEA